MPRSKTITIGAPEACPHCGVRWANMVAAHTERGLMWSVFYPCGYTHRYDERGATTKETSCERGTVIR